LSCGWFLARAVQTPHLFGATLDKVLRKLRLK
jgi:hypothetical protein